MMSRLSKPKKLRVSIGFKLASLLVFVLLSATGSIVFFSTQLFEQDNTALIQQLNLDTASHQSVLVKQIFHSLTQRMRFFASVLRTSVKTESAMLGDEIFQGDEDFLALILQEHSKNEVRLGRVVISQNLQKSGVGSGEELLQLLRNEKRFDVGQLSKGESQVVSFKMADGTQAMVLGVPLQEDASNANHFSMSAIAVVRQSLFLKSFTQSNVVTSYLLDRRGHLMAHPDTSLAIGEENFSDLEIVKQLMQGKFNNGQTKYFDPRTSQKKLGAFSLVGFAGLGVVSEVPEAKAFEAAERVKYRSILIAVIVLSLSLVAGLIYSESITWPIKQLVFATQKIAQGDFSFRVAPKTRDEVAELSYAFNEMVDGLRERDRVKATFNKFHNKEIAEKILSGDVKLGGESRTALIFFSDIRGFTQLSEAMTPEAVVEMLNEYMSRMVSIIRKYGGVVDKYVGDAIMAVWGVPVEGASDAHNALSACLAMRLELEELNRVRMERGEPTLLMGMGLNRGTVVAGNIGSEEKMDYTVIGDSVNVASRIESMTKTFGTDLLVAQSVFEALSEKFIFEPCEAVTVKGKSEALKVYRVLGYFSEDGKRVLVETPFSQYQTSHSEKAGSPQRSAA